jgi:FkbM family methyltransferase
MIFTATKSLLRQIVPVHQKRLLIRYALANGAEVAFERLRAKGFRPGFAIDVGAYHGEWTRAFARVFKGTPVLMIEAQTEKRGRLEGAARRIGSHVTVEMALLSNEADREVPFFVMETGSSIYSENTSAPRRQVMLRTETLDAVRQRHIGLQTPYLVKLDVQGAELDVLRGGTATLRDTEVVMLEVSILEYNDGAPNFREVTSFLTAAGFVLYDIANLIRLPTDDLCQLDAIFLREDSALRPTGLLG